MSDLAFMLATMVAVFVLATLWALFKEVLERWLSNDWCRHEWGMWENRRDEFAQTRYCSKCNKMEKRIP